MGLFSSGLGAIGTLAGGPIGGAIGESFGSYIDDKNKADYSWKRQKRMFNWQKDWELYKMENAHQIEMQDLKLAGINPLATATMGGAQGSGAPTGGNTPTFNDTSTPFSETMNNLTQVENANKMLPSQVNLNESQAFKNKKEAGVIDKKANAEIKESESRTAVNQAKTSEIRTNTELNTERIKEQELQNAIMEVQKEVNSGNFGKALAYWDRAVASLGTTIEVAASIRNAILSKDKRKIAEVTEIYRDGKGREVGRLKRYENKK